eukprot:TRINITY_DN4863_c0_g1_i5.p1 TRINITY_DN4863_c0_g1~~TRINITY_DN4863_c0_g1_i5.p1  ORF type:complete len:317 (-),score=60.16 TRINITY_DN4863_c0_g1_i5:660-1610(-)
MLSHPQQTQQPIPQTHMHTHNIPAHSQLPMTHPHSIQQTVSHSQQGHYGNTSQGQHYGHEYGHPQDEPHHAIRQAIRVAVSVGIDDADVNGSTPFIVPCYEGDTVLGLKNEILTRCLRMPTGVRITQILPEKDQRPACWLVHKDLGELNDKDNVGDVCRDNDHLLAIFNKKENIPSCAARVGKGIMTYPPAGPSNPHIIAPSASAVPVAAPTMPMPHLQINTASKKELRQHLTPKLTQLVVQVRDECQFSSAKDFQNRLKSAGGRIGNTTMHKLKLAGYFGPYIPKSRPRHQETASSNEMSSDEDSAGDHHIGHMA